MHHSVVVIFTLFMHFSIILLCKWIYLVNKVFRESSIKYLTVTLT